MLRTHWSFHYSIHIQSWYRPRSVSGHLWSPTHWHHYLYHSEHTKLHVLNGQQKPVFTCCVTDVLLWLLWWLSETQIVFCSVISLFSTCSAAAVQ